MWGHDDAATTRRRRRQPRCRCSPGSQSLQPPRSQSLQCPGRHRSFRRRYSPSLAAAPSLQVPAAALPHGPHCSPDPRGWVVEARTTTRRPALVVGAGRKGRRVTLISKAHSSVPNRGMGAQTADHWAQSARGAAFWTGWCRGGDAARRGAVGRHRRPGRCGSYCSATSGSCPRCRTPSAGRRCSARSGRRFPPRLTENQRSDQKIFPFLEWLRVGEAEQVELRDAVQGAQEFPNVGPDTCLVISHAHRIAINEQEKGSGAGRRCAGAGTKAH